MHADHLKLMFPMGWTVSTMAWGILDGYQLLSKQTYDGQTNLAWALETLEYGLQFLLDCSYENGEFVAQVRHLAYLSTFSSFCVTSTLLLPGHGQRLKFEILNWNVRNFAAADWSDRNRPQELLAQ